MHVISWWANRQTVNGMNPNNLIFFRAVNSKCCCILTYFSATVGKCNFQCAVSVRCSLKGIDSISSHSAMNTSIEHDHQYSHRQCEGEEVISSRKRLAFIFATFSIEIENWIRKSIRSAYVKKKRRRETIISFICTLSLFSQPMVLRWNLRLICANEAIAWSRKKSYCCEQI